MANPAAKPTVSPASGPAPPAAVEPPVLVSPPQKKFNVLYVVLPLILVVAVGIGVGWEVFRANLEAAQQSRDREARLGVDGPIGAQKDRRSRELKPIEVPVPLRAVAPDDDELTGLGKRKKPPLQKVVNQSPVERTWRLLKADFDKLEAKNETTARKYRIRILRMEDRRANTPEELFVKEASVLQEALKLELTKPENQ